MQTINRKGRLIETYSLILIDLICVLGAYLTALLLRFGNVQQALNTQLHYTVGVFMMLFCVLYGVMSDWNRGFFKRGFFVEGIAILKYDAVSDTFCRRLFQTDIWLFCNCKCNLYIYSTLPFQNLYVGLLCKEQ